MKTTVIFAICMFITALAFCEDPKDYVIQLQTSTTEDPPSISFKWNKTPEMSRTYDINIYRKNKDSIEWGQPIDILLNDATDYVDTTVEPGIEYEYAIKGFYGFGVNTYVTAGIKCKEVEYRGKIILLVDSTFVDDLKMELSRYESDLIGDGWEVLRKDISRNASVKYVKSIIHDFYNSDPENVNTIFLFGHIPVPYSGNFAYDGHVEHAGAWPADMYYGSMNEKIWQDVSVNYTATERYENNNVSGDGKFDTNKLPTKESIKLSVGRTDFHNLPAFPQSETELLRNYLNKNHAFRHKTNNPKMQALIDDNWGILKYSMGMKEAFSISGWRNFTALLNFKNIKTGKFFADTKNDSYIWSYACGGGNFDSCKYVGSTTRFVNQSPKTVFTAFYGSRFGDWDSENNFMRAGLASNGWILTSCWAGRPHYTFHQMGMGATIGYCVRATQNNLYNYYSGLTNRGIHTSLLGDPALRMHIVQPVNSIKSAITDMQTVRLSWNQSEDDIIGYYIYKLDTTLNKYFRISNASITETYFEDSSPDKGNNYYMVRTLKLSNVASGSYYNLSQGIFDTIRYEKSHVKLTDENQTAPVIEVNESLETPQIALKEKVLHSNVLSGNQWYFNDTLIPGATDSVYTPVNSGDYYVKTTLDNGHSAKSNYIFIPIDSKEYDEINNVLIYPNPSTGVFNISFGSNINNVSIMIFNLQGKLLREETFQNTFLERFDISTLPKGIYVVKGVIDNNKMITKICLQ